MSATGSEPTSKAAPASARIGPLHYSNNGPTRTFAGNAGAAAPPPRAPPFAGPALAGATVRMTEGDVGVTAGSAVPGPAAPADWGGSERWHLTLTEPTQPATCAPRPRRAPDQPIRLDDISPALKAGLYLPDFRRLRAPPSADSFGLFYALFGILFRLVPVSGSARFWMVIPAAIAFPAWSLPFACAGLYADVAPAGRPAKTSAGSDILSVIGPASASAKWAWMAFVTLFALWVWF